MAEQTKIWVVFWCGEVEDIDYGLLATSDGVAFEVN
jgi:hypothetical protein